jgi:F-type H+-transporting ATPase subunit b
MGNLLSYAQTLPLQAAAESEESDNPLLAISPGLMVWTLVMFGITLFILKRYVFGPLGAAIEKRRSHIAESIGEAERSRDEATAMLEDYKARLVDARKEADALREQGRKEGERQRAELLTEAQAQRERVIADAGVQIDAEVRQAAGGLRDDVVSLALMAAEKVSRSTLSEADHRRLIEEAIADADLSRLALDGSTSTS